MLSMRDRCRRSAVYQYFAVMQPGDRATVLIVLALLSAWAVAFAGIVRSREPYQAPRTAPAASSSPRLTAPPFELRFA